MIWLAILGFSTVFLLICSVYLHPFGNQAKQYNQILADVGLESNRRPDSTPYYKWGWRKHLDERVWGERIVRQAFEKANVWLSPDDLPFFKNACDQYAAGQSVNEDEIRSYIEKILNRTGNIFNCATKHIQGIISELMSTSEEEASNILKGMGINAEKDRALRQLGIIQFRKMMMNIGLEIMGLKSQGFEVTDENGELLFTLQGFDGWNHWLKACETELQKLGSNSMTAANRSLLLYLKKNISARIIKDYQEDLNKSKNFISSLEKEIDQRELNVSLGKIENLEYIFYQWKFTNGIPFNKTDHQRIRDLLMRKDISPLFRGKIIEAINPNFGSLLSLMKTYPKKVIFYGPNPYIRAFASQQYLAHLEVLIKILSAASGKNIQPPALLIVSEVDLEKAREGNIEEEEFNNSSKQKKGFKKKISSKVYMPEVIEKQKQLSIMERNLDEATAEVHGWVIDMAVDDFLIEEYAYLDSGPYRNFVRFPCNDYGDIDFTSQSDHAKRQKLKYFDMVLEYLTQTPAIGKKSKESILTE